MSKKFNSEFGKGEKVERLAPLPLRRATAAAAPYPIKALGKVLGDAALAIMDKIACPDAIAAQSVLGAAALAAQAHADVVHPATGDARPLSLFLVTVAATGERKSAADKIALGPIGLREAELYDKHERDRRTYTDAHAVYAKARDAIINAKGDQKQDATKRLAALGPSPVAPLIPLLTAPEPTLEGLHKLMAIGEPSMGLFSDEGGTFIGGYGMSDDAKLRTGSGLSDMWDGKTVKRVRGGDGISILKGRRLSLHIMVQPGIAEALLADPTLLQQGLPSRLLVSAPTSLAGTRMQRPPKETTEPAIKRYSDRILKLLRLDQRRAGPNNPELRPRQLQLSTAARPLWSAFADKCERELADGGRLEPVRGFANKLGEQALRIAGVLEVIDNPGAKDVSKEAMQRAITIASYYGNEALRIFEHGSASIEIQRAEKVKKWLHERWGKPIIALPHVYQFGPNSIRDAARAREAVTILEHHHWLKPLPGGATIEGKRYREAWEVIFDGGS